MKKGFIVLSHQGVTMVGAIAEQLKRRGLVACVLSSSSARDVTPDWLDQVDSTVIVESLSLTEQHVNDFIVSIGTDVQIVGCISVWDAYRHLMAEANRYIGARDLQPETVSLLRDKFAFRNALHSYGLSRKRARLLDEDSCATLDEPANFFVKPRTGLASFGAFRADTISSYQELEEVWNHTASDRAYDGVFGAQPAFIAEDFIRGAEFSFEVTVSQSRVTVHAIHEKIDLTLSKRTVLENACVCPPISIDAEQLAAGSALVQRSLLALGAQEGVYHVEARYHEEDGWEIVEANPRIGGAYIVDSTRLHCGVDLIGRWIELIYGECAPVEADERRRTFFRVFFGEPGRTVARLDRGDTGLPIVVDRLFVKEGECLPSIDREIFIGQALWDITSLPTDELAAFVDTTKAHFSVEYRS